MARWLAVDRVRPCPSGFVKEGVLTVVEVKGKFGDVRREKITRDESKHPHISVESRCVYVMEEPLLIGSFFTCRPHMISGQVNRKYCNSFKLGFFLFLQGDVSLKRLQLLVDGQNQIKLHFMPTHTLSFL